MLRIKRTAALIVGTSVVVAATAAGASAATTIGETFDPTGGPVCAGGGMTVIQTAPAQYAVPTNGVLTAWSIRAGDTPGRVKLKVARTSGSNLFIVGESTAQSPATHTLGTFPTRIPVQSGDMIGLTVLEQGQCARIVNDPAYVAASPDSPDPPPGSTHSFTSEGDFQTNVSARLEADADGDGFGDETQDQCPSDSSTQGACDLSPPETTITKRPDNEISRPKARYRFTADEPGSTFECRLRGKEVKDKLKQFRSCTSPKRYKNLDPGRYRFKVRATDAAGNTDPTPARDKFKVVD